MPRKHWQREEVDEPAEAKVCIHEEGHVKSLNDHRAIGVLADFPPAEKRKSQMQNITPRMEQLDSGREQCKSVPGVLRGKIPKEGVLYCSTPRRKGRPIPTGNMKSALSRFLRLFYGRDAVK